MNTPKPPRDSAIEFPCDFPVKAMGLASKTLHLTVLEIVRKHAPDTADTALKTRPSSNGKYVSVTVTVHATSQTQLDAIYTDLTASEQVLMAL
ncbi:MAG TPA: DUF493 domain-containing protein [Chromatiales bacterium]|nr:DUF493 domain-containing protein [Chromatiales bacterium]HEX22492.1 DUF493 domain-containing protein [Chromatiales bacterium]